MKIISTLLILQILLSCNNSQSLKTTSNDRNYDTVLLNENFTINPKDILKDFNTWYSYAYYNTRLSQDFIALDVDSVKIDKTTFLNQLMTKKAVAFKIRLFQGEPVYKLYKLNSRDESIKSTIQQMASIEMKNFKMEGKQIPEFNFTDLNGKNYTSSSTKGKLLVLKCWFIHCVACVKEFPACNALVDKNKNRNDILFISLARDQKKDLEKFLKITQFKYDVVPEMGNYMTDQLHVNEYPTLLLISKTGKIIKVTNSIEELIPFIKKEEEHWAVSE